MIAHGMKLPGHGGVIQYSDMSAESWRNRHILCSGWACSLWDPHDRERALRQSKREAGPGGPKYVEAFLLGLKKKRYKHLWPHPMALRCTAT